MLKWSTFQVEIIRIFNSCNYTSCWLWPITILLQVSLIFLEIVDEMTDENDNVMYLDTSTKKKGSIIDGLTHC